jgi:NAD(P)-dependent dehydrogenase (short-subunit alcohol dehydrogenase family)
MHDRVAIVTAAGQGIGAGIARSLAGAGFRLSLMSLSERGIRLAEELGGVGRQGSVLDAGDIAGLVEVTRAAYGRIDAVVINTGHGSGEPPEVTAVTGFDPEAEADPLAFPDDGWHQALDMYVLSVVRAARAVTPVFQDQGGGAIVNVSSFRSIEPQAGYAQMSVLRRALHGFTKVYADRYARDGIRMNSVLPGYCENVAMTDEARRSIPMGRQGRFDEIGQACVFLASEQSSYITGQTLLVDGGFVRSVA